MSQSSDNTKKPNDKTDAKELRTVATFENLILLNGSIVIFCTFVLSFSPGPTDFVVVPLISLALVAVLTYVAISMVRIKILERFREIDELKSKIQELEEKLAQK